MPLLDETRGEIRPDLLEGLPAYRSTFISVPLPGQGIGPRITTNVINEVKAPGFQTVPLFSPDSQSFLPSGDKRFWMAESARNRDTPIMERALRLPHVGGDT